MFDAVAWRAAHSEENKTYQKKWRKRNPDYEKERGRVRTTAARRKEYLKGKYGLTVGQFLEMAEAQGHTCPLCQKVCARSERPKSGLHVDHDHSTGKVRGLLCGPCNRTLGKLGDSVEGIELFLSRARAYLERA